MARLRDQLEVSLTGWAFGGDALGRADDGRMIFAPFCLPDERVRGRVIEDRARWARILPEQWFSRAADRIDPLCPHFSECGGCHYQHVDYSLQLSIKSAIVAEQLERIGGFHAPPVDEIIPSPQPWNYRNNMRYHVLTRRPAWPYSEPAAQNPCRLKPASCPNPSYWR